MVDCLAIDGEAGAFVGHEPLSLGCADCRVRFSTVSKGLWQVASLPEPHKFVLPLLQNLHSLHSKKMVRELCTTQKERCNYLRCRGE